MLYYDRTNLSEGIDVNKTRTSKECDVCHYWYLLNYRFKFQPNLSNSCDDLPMMSISLSDIAILNINSYDYCCITSLISKKKAINIMQNADFTRKSETL